jgi:hypothetical protein
MLARHAIGEKPCPLRTKSRERLLKDAAAAEVIQRCGDPELDDRLDDLF